MDTWDWVWLAVAAVIVVAIVVQLVIDRKHWRGLTLVGVSGALVGLFIAIAAS